LELHHPIAALGLFLAVVSNATVSSSRPRAPERPPAMPKPKASTLRTAALSAIAVSAGLSLLAWSLHTARHDRALRKAQTTQKTRKPPSELSAAEVEAVHSDWKNAPVSLQPSAPKFAAQPHADDSTPTPATTKEEIATLPLVSTTMYEHHPERPLPPPIPTSKEVEERLVNAWQAQPADEAWSKDMRQTAQRVLAQAGVPADRLHQVDCRASLCRLQLQFASREEAVRLYTSRPAGMNGFRTWKDLQFVVFLPRPGQRLEQFFSAESDDPVD
jgi:hypothetical protein